MIKQYKKKPVIITACRFPDWNEPQEEFYNWSESVGLFWARYPDGSTLISTLEGELTARPGDFIIRGIKDEFYPCRADIFESTYELINE